MPDIGPMTAAAGERPRARPIPDKVKRAIKIMVYGAPGDIDHKPLDFIAAAKLVSMDPPTMRKYFDRGDCRQLLLSERRTFRSMLCAGNEAALARIRDGDNAMASVKAALALESLDEAHAERHGRDGQRELPGVVIRIVGNSAPTTIDVTAFDSSPSPLLPAPINARLPIPQPEPPPREPRFEPDPPFRRR